MYIYIYWCMMIHTLSKHALLKLRLIVWVGTQSSVLLLLNLHFGMLGILSRARNTKWSHGFLASPVALKSHKQPALKHHHYIQLIGLKTIRNRNQTHVLTGSSAVHTSHPIPLISDMFFRFSTEISSSNLEKPRLNREKSEIILEKLVFGVKMGEVTWCHKACPTHNSSLHPPLAPDRSSSSPEGSAPFEVMNSGFCGQLLITGMWLPWSNGSWVNNSSLWISLIPCVPVKMKRCTTLGIFNARSMAPWNWSTRPLVKAAIVQFSPEAVDTVRFTRPGSMDIETVSVKWVYMAWAGVDNDSTLKAIAIAYTPPKTNMKPKNVGFEDDFPFQRGDFQIPC